jgi:hypothetical protein
MDASRQLVAHSGRLARASSELMDAEGSAADCWPGRFKFDAERFELLALDDFIALNRRDASPTRSSL